MGAADKDPGLHTTLLPLTAAQHGIWMGQHLDPASPAYLTAEAVEITGALDTAAFEAALRDVLTACDSLHMRFTHDGQAVWQRLERQADWPLNRMDLSHEADPWACAKSWMRAQLTQAVSLEQGPLFATALLQLSADRHLWFLRVHHVALDGFGYALLAQSVAANYSARMAGLAPAQPAWALDRVVEEDLLYQGSPNAQRDLAFWQARLADAPAPVTLAPPAAIAHSVRRCAGGLSSNAFEKCRQVSDAAKLDWAAWMLASVAAWLYQRTGQADITLGLPVMNRLGSVALSVPCMAMNIVPLRLKVEPARSIYALAQQAAAALRALRPHQRYRYEQLRHDLGRVGGQKRLFGPVVNLMPFDRPLQFGGLMALSHPLSAGPVEDLSITAVPSIRGLRLDLEANPNAYDDQALAQHRDTLLATIVQLTDHPDTPLCDVLGPAHGSQALKVTALLSGGPLPGPAVPVLEAWTNWVQKSPQHPALQQDGVVLSHGELLAQVQSMAGRLVAHGVRPGHRVALLLPREPRTVVALLAVLWAGACYVPLDPDGPAARRAMVITDSQASLILTLEAHAGPVRERHPDLNVLCLDGDQAGKPFAPLTQAAEADPDALAYIIYTSGSTGQPNGVMVGRAALAHFVAGATARYQFTSADRMLQFSPLHFDASVEEIFLPLTNGATLVLRTDAMLDSMPALMAACEAQAISVLDLPTAFWHELAYSVGHGDALLASPIRLVIIGGEAALAERVTRWRRSVPEHVVLLNTYGPTETTVICTTATLSGPGALPIHEGEAVPIGTPLPGVDIAVVDDELCVIGPALAHGYQGRDELTARRFIKLDTLPGQPRAYRTGDRVQLGQDGQLRYLGRLDDEFKLSGHRIDPAEVETALLSLAGIREAAVIGQTSAQGTKRLVAFLVSDQHADPAILRTALADRLPAPAVPSFYVFMPRLPRNANNKINRNALRDHDTSDSPAAAVVATPFEQAIIAVWQDVLGNIHITPDDDFFMLGGKSLQAIQVATRLGVALQRAVPVSLLFRHPSAASLAQALAAPVGHQPPPAAAGHELAPLLTIQGGEGPALFCVHPAEGLSWCYFGLSRQLPDMPIIGLQARGITGDAPASFSAMVTDYLGLIREAQPHGPYHLLGWSSGGGIAHALAVRLRQLGEAVSLLAMMDSYPCDIWKDKPEPQERDALEAVLDVIGASPQGPDGQPLSEEALRDKLRQPGSSLAGFEPARLQRLTEMALHSMKLYRDADHQVFDGDLLFFHAARRPAHAPDWLGWTPYVSGAMQRVDIDSTHSGMSQPAPLSHVGRVLAEHITPLASHRSTS
ncbi:MAG: non-ribosomal peptide synthetase [Leptothrix sp. (in: Bacteria)]|nr:non-ribosomal peptide synthetase [Leptothrix sp. (in: b-proteobacteria)]